MNTELLFCRQTLVNKKQQIVGYELIVNSENEETNKANILFILSSNVDNSSFPKDRLLFLDLPDEVSSNEFILKISRQIVFILPLDMVLTSEKQEFLSFLSKQGFGFCLNNLNSETIKLFKVANYLKMDIRQIDANRFVQLSSEIHKYPVKQIADRIETEEAFLTCSKTDVDLMQGNYFIKPRLTVRKTVGPAMVSLFNLMSMVQSDASVAKMEEVLKRDAALSYKLLRYINSVGFGLSCEITSYAHAVTILGYRKLYKWLSLLMVMTASKETTPQVLIKTAAIRGRFAELVGQSYLDEAERDNLFLAGLFSLLDAVLQMPMQDALKQINLSKDLNDALLKRQGVYSSFIDLVEACEQRDTNKLERVADSLQLTPTVVNSAHLTALSWAETLGI